MPIVRAPFAQVLSNDMLWAYYVKFHEPRRSKGRKERFRKWVASLNKPTKRKN